MSCEVAAARDPPAGSARILGFHVDRLTLRFALGVALAVVVPLAAGLALLTTREYDRAIAARRHSAELENRILEAALRHQMVEKDPALMRAVLGEIGKDPEVLGAMILNHEGEVRMASDPVREGTRLDRDAPECMACHAKSAPERGTWTTLHEESGSMLRSVLPIRNEPSCHRCHGEENRVNGILILDLSLAPIVADLRNEGTWAAAGTVVLGLCLLTGVGLFVRNLVLRRIVRLGRVARTIAKGDLTARVPEKGDDVIAALGSDVNGMAQSVQDLLARIAEQEARLVNVVNSLEDGLVVLDSSSRIVACNRSFGRTLQRRPEEARGLVCHQAGEGRLPCCDASDDCPAALCLATGEVQRAVFRSPPGTDGRRRVHEVYASPVHDGDGGVVQVVEIWRDITERVDEEARLAEIERMVSLGVLASGFSHEVNTPLATTLTCAESMIGRLDDAPSAADPATLTAIRESATIIRQQVLRCRRVTDEFLRFSRGVPPSIEPFELTRRVAEVVALVAPTAREKGATIRVEESGPVPLVRANTEVVHHVVLNLLVNALQSFDGPGGSVAVSFLVGDDVRIRIRDTGSGIAPGDRAHLFEPFRSRKPHGTGLGLFLSRSFMRRFGGDVRLVESEVGRGSCFDVVFRRAREDRR